MEHSHQQLDTLKDIKQMMERSSRFISLSGLSGIAAGICGLVSAWFASDIFYKAGSSPFGSYPIQEPRGFGLDILFNSRLFWIAIITFIVAFILAVVFTYSRSKKNNSPIWSVTSRRVLFAVAIPMLAGVFFVYKLLAYGTYDLVIGGCLLFYGLALINGSKFTLSEVRYLGYGQLFLGIISLFYPGYGLYFWAVGFGLLHIIYGSIMWWKYERK